MTMNQGYHHSRSKKSTMIPSSEVSSAYSSDTDESEELERIGNINWCNCFAMETNTESLCCHDKNEVPACAF